MPSLQAWLRLRAYVADTRSTSSINRDSASCAPLISSHGQRSFPMSSNAYELVIFGGNAGGLSVAVSMQEAGLEQVRILEPSSAVAFPELVGEHQLDVGYGETVQSIALAAPSDTNSDGGASGSAGRCQAFDASAYGFCHTQSGGLRPCAGRLSSSSSPPTLVRQFFQRLRYAQSSPFHGNRPCRSTSVVLCCHQNGQ